MYCNFCGKNFERAEGFEEVRRGSDRLIRCESCVSEQRDEEYDWQVQVYGRGRQMSRYQGPQ